MESAPQSETTEKRPGRRRVGWVRRLLVWTAWTVPSIWIVLIGLLILPFLLVRVPAMRVWILDRSVEDQLLAPGQRIRIDDVARLDPGGFDFRGLHVESETDSGWQRWFSVERVHANWSTGNLLQRRIDIGTVYVQAPRLDWLAVPNPVFASHRSAPRTRGPLSLPPIRCDSLVVNDARIVQGPDPWFEGTLRMRDLRQQDGDVAGILEIGRAYSVRDSVELRLSDGSLRGRLIEEFTVDSLRVSSAGLEGRLDATLRTDPSGASRLSLEGLLQRES